MKYVVDANIIPSALISDSMTRQLLVKLKDDLLTPAYVHDEIGKYTEMVSEKSRLTQSEVEDSSSSFSNGSTSSHAPKVLGSLQESALIMQVQDIDPDDAVYLAAALKRDAQL